MKLVIFSGPTLCAADAAIDAEMLPPAHQGDLYRAARHGAQAIGLIDGYFDQVNSVAHKEILWAMANGVHVFGAASMGALRAAELELFGMEGVGTIFNQYRSGALEDDDEVAVAHASAEDGYRALSEAMVNIRATFAAAARQRVISEATRQLLISTAKALFYGDRSFPLILARAEAEAAPPAELKALCAFLPTGRVDQKRSDALALVRRLREHRDSRPAPKTVKYFFSHTDAWEALRRRVDGGA
jgi:hypothetical protein